MDKGEDMATEKFEELITKIYKDAKTIGKDIPWKAIEKEDCRVLDFEPIATIQKGEIKDVSKFVPYAVLLIESPKLPKGAMLPVSHREDFRNLWKVFMERTVSPEEEVIVFYMPFFKKRILNILLSTLMPKLHIHLYTKGWQEIVHRPNFRFNNLRDFQPIAKWQPKYWRGKGTIP